MDRRFVRDRGQDQSSSGSQPYASPFDQPNGKAKEGGKKDSGGGHTHGLRAQAQAAREALKKSRTRKLLDKISGKSKTALHVHESQPTFSLPSASKPVPRYKPVLPMHPRTPAPPLPPDSSSTPLPPLHPLPSQLSGPLSRGNSFQVPSITSWTEADNDVPSPVNSLKGLHGHMAAGDDSGEMPLWNQDSCPRLEPHTPGGDVTRNLDGQGSAENMEKALKASKLTEVVDNLRQTRSYLEDIAGDLRVHALRLTDGMAEQLTARVARQMMEELDATGPKLKTIEAAIQRLRSAEEFIADVKPEYDEAVRWQEEALQEISNELHKVDLGGILEMRGSDSSNALNLNDVETDDISMRDAGDLRHPARVSSMQGQGSRDSGGDANPRFKNASSINFRPRVADFARPKSFEEPRQAATVSGSGQTGQTNRLAAAAQAETRHQPPAAVGLTGQTGRTPAAVGLTGSGQTGQTGAVVEMEPTRTPGAPHQLSAAVGLTGQTGKTPGAPHQLSAAVGLTGQTGSTKPAWSAETRQQTSFDVQKHDSWESGYVAEAAIPSSLGAAAIQFDFGGRQDSGPATQQRDPAPMHGVEGTAGIDMSAAGSLQAEGDLNINGAKSESVGFDLEDPVALLGARLCQTVRTARFHDVIDVCDLVDDVEKQLDTAPDRSAVLGSPDWPTDRYNALTLAVKLQWELTCIKDRKEAIGVTDDPYDLQMSDIMRIFDEEKSNLYAYRDEIPSVQHQMCVQDVPFDPNELMTATKIVITRLAEVYMRLVIKEVSNLEAEGKPHQQVLNLLQDAMQQSVRFLMFAETFEDTCKDLYNQLGLMVDQRL